MKHVLVVVLVALALPASAFAWGGYYATGDTLGTSVDIQVSDSYPVGDTLPQTWATFLGSLVHGQELARLALHLQTPAEVGDVCGAGALACYDPGSDTMYATPEDQPGEPTAREIVMHEYGHHIAANQDDAPWAAEDWGTKRWSTYENICARDVAGVVAPGDEGGDYALNPGEAFAETYRALNLTKEGATSFTWALVAPMFYPDATALSLLEQDITSPWTGPTQRSLHGSFGYGPYRTFGVLTPLDGTFTAVLHAPARSRMRLALYAGTKLVGRGGRLTYVVCGRRQLTLRVERTSGRGAFSVDISKP